MGRNIPHNNTSKSLTINKGSSFFFLVAAIAASLAIFITLCVSHHRKPSGQKSKQTTSSSSSSDSSKKSSIEKTKLPTLSPPPPPQENGEKTPPTPKRKLSTSLSMRFPEGLAKIRTSVKKDKQHAASNAEEVVDESSASVWMKTIILGEKCRVDSDEEEELVMYDKKGNKKRNYHPRTPRSLPVSRTNSFAFSERNGS